MRGKHSEFATGHIADEELERVGRLIGAVREIYHGRVVGQETLYSALVTSLICLLYTSEAETVLLGVKATR